MFISRLSPLSMLVVACSLAVATAAIAGSGPGGDVVDWGPIEAPPRTPVISSGPDNPTVSTVRHVLVRGSRK